MSSFVVSHFNSLTVRGFKAEVIKGPFSCSIGCCHIIDAVGDKDLQKGIIKNARALADGLIQNGLQLAYGGTDTHLMLLDLKSIEAPPARPTGISSPVWGEPAVRIMDLAGMVANNCVDGLSLIESTVVMSRGMTGTGNSGWGLRARRSSFVTIDRTTSDPSVTGTLGDVELDSGSSTWTTILGGTALVDPVEMASVYVDTALIQEAGW